jgi:hypothetical protein
MITVATPQKSIEKESTPLEKALTQGSDSQTTEILAYLEQELGPERPEWLKEGHAQSLLEAAKENPLETLARWQDISGDNSFKPSVPEISLTKEQQDKALVVAHESAIKIDAHERNYTPQEQEILDYLRQELTPEKTPWLEKPEFERFLKAAEENPAHMLKRWQGITDDYSFEIPADIPGKTGELNDQPIDDRKNQEAEILAYLHSEIRADKHEWLSSGYAEEILNSAKDDPFATLDRWKELSGDGSFKCSEPEVTLTQEQMEAKKTQEAEILTYLHSEVRADKHKWLSSGYAEEILNSAKDDPFATLDRWKDLSGDSSFEPSIPDALMSDEQRNIKRNILAYLKENIQVNEQDIDGKAQQKILKLAENNPDKGLQEWQILTGNYDYNPHADRMGLRELKVNEYLKEKLAGRHDSLSQKMKTEIVTHLHTNPLKAYDCWQLYSSDKTFDPKTGIPVIETQAQKLMDSIKTPVPDDLLKSWQGQMTNNPEAVLQECQKFIQDRNEQDMLHKSVDQFIDLSERYEKLSWDDPQRDKIEQGIHKITNRYLNDKEFMEKVEGSKSQAASERLADEIREKDRTLLHDMGGRGMGM